MPSIPDVPSVLAIQLKLRVGNANVVSRVNVRYASAAPTRQQLMTYASSIDTAIGEHLLHLCSVQVKTVEIMITDLTATSSARAIVASDQQGTRPGLWNGAGVAALINFKVARRYQGGKPRLYLPFFVAADARFRAWPPRPETERGREGAPPRAKRRRIGTDHRGRSSGSP